MSSAELHDWNPASHRKAGQPVRVHDETLRDGLQNPSVKDPDLDTKIEILHLLESVGVDSVSVGLPAAGPRALEQVEVLCREIVDSGMRIRANCAARTVASDIAPIVDVSQKLGLSIEVTTFIGSSPIRQLAEHWSPEFIRERSVAAIDFAVGHDLPTTYVTEDTTRSNPEVLRDLFTTAIEHGASRICLCDTVGHATPWGVAALIRFSREVADSVKPGIGIDFHGHADRGLALANTLAAFEEGADRLHGCLLGVGERVGNAPIELILRNLGRIGWGRDRDLSRLDELCRLVARTAEFPLPPQVSEPPRDLAHGPAF
ncbi:MAG: 2-isopropylmalate synthase [Deltaproteobacteria bacterium]|nr:2-isopropylmalate synthase [Deltaproteobacteria bacterium]